MKQRYRLFRRGEVYYSEDTLTGKQLSLQTKHRGQALRLIHQESWTNLTAQITIITNNIATIEAADKNYHQCASDWKVAKMTFETIKP